MTEALAAATVWASITPGEGRETELEGEGGGREGGGRGGMEEWKKQKVEKAK